MVIDGLTNVISQEEEVVVRSPPLQNVEEVEVLPVHVSYHHHLNTRMTFERKKKKSMCFDIIVAQCAVDITPDILLPAAC